MKNRMRRLALLLALVLALGLLPVTAAAANVGDFADVSDTAWYADAVKFVSEQGLMDGVSDTAFDPNGTVTRGMIVTILYRQAGSPKAAAGSAFADVPVDAWYAVPVSWAAAEGIVDGYSETAFGPNDAVTREQLAAILFRFAGKTGADVSKRGDLKAFTDADTVSGWAKDAVQWAAAEGLLNGVTDDTLVPAGTATRAQAAAILMRFLDKPEPALPLTLMKTAEVYRVDFETKEWALARVLTFEYDEHGNPVKIDTYETDADMHIVQTFEYDYQDGLPAERRDFRDDGVQIQTVTYSKNGNVYDIQCTDPGYSEGIYKYQYANGDGYFTLQLGETYYYDSETGDLSFTMEEIDAVQVTTENGLLKQTTNVGLYANWNAGDEKPWERFNGTYSAFYDANGIIEHTSAVFRAGPPGTPDLFDVQRENGRVTEVIRSEQREGQTPEAQERFVFTYTDVEITPARYAMMINETVIGPSNNFYRYYWY